MQRDSVVSDRRFDHWGVGMDELKEKIARAIAEEDVPELRWVELLHKPYLKLAQAALTAIEEAGFRIVPAQATTAQLSAGAKAWVADPARLSSTLYRAMVEAAKSQPMSYRDDPRPARQIIEDDNWPGHYSDISSDSATSFDPEKQFEKDNGI